MVKNILLRVTWKSLLLMILAIVVMPSNSTAQLQKPLVGPALRRDLTKEEYDRARKFMTVKTNYHVNKSIDAKASIEEVEKLHDRMKMALDIVSFIDSSKSFADNTANRTAKILDAVNYLKNNTLISSKPFLNKVFSKYGLKIGSDAFDAALHGFAFYCAELSDKLPESSSDPKLNEFASSIDAGTPETIASNMVDLLENSAVGDFAFGVIMGFVTSDKFPTIAQYSINMWKTKSYLTGFSDTVKAAKVGLGPVYYVTKAANILVDITGAKLAGNVTEDMNSMLIALDFLDYYYVTYGGNLDSFKDALGVSSIWNIKILFQNFINQQAEWGGTYAENYGLTFSPTFLFGGSFNVDTAVQNIKDIIVSNGLATRIDSSSSAYSLGDSISINIMLDPILSKDFSVLPVGNSLSAKYEDASLSTYNLNFLYDYLALIYHATQPITATVPGHVDVSTIMHIKDNSSGTPYYPQDNSTYIVTTPSSSVGVKFFDIFDLGTMLDTNPKQAKLFQSSNGNYLTFGLEANYLDFLYYSLNGYTGSIDETLGTIRYRVIDDSTNNILIPWTTFKHNGGNFEDLPVLNNNTLLSKSGLLGSYLFEISITHPYIAEDKIFKYRKSFDYIDVVIDASAATTPYLQILVSSKFKADYNSFDQSFYAGSGDQIRLKIENVVPYPFVNLIGETVQVVIYFPNGEAKVVSGTLVGDEVIFNIDKTTDGITMPAGRYQIYTVFGIDSRNNKIRIPQSYFSIKQLVEFDSAIIGTTNPPPPSTTGMITLPRTGQYRCYDTAGAEIPCAGTGQDGDIQAGKPWSQTPRFTDNGDQTMTDTVTGLIWTKDANAPGPEVCGPGTSKTWQGALDYVDCLNNNSYLNRADWRLPNRKELKSIFHPSYYSTEGFNNVKSQYWSSSSHGSFKNYAWAIGIDSHVYSIFKGGFSISVWPVRGGDNGGDVQLPRTGQTSCYNELGAAIDCTIQGQTQDAAMHKGVTWSAETRFTNNNNGTITDKLTGLIWLQNANCFSWQDWQSALNSASSLVGDNTQCSLNDDSMAGDWRLPNPEELESLIDLHRSGPALPTDNLFSNVHFSMVSLSQYWTSSSYYYSYQSAFTVDMNHGDVSVHSKINSAYVWPVRGGKLDSDKIGPPATSLISENLPDGSYQVGPATKVWRFKSGAFAILGLKAVKVTDELGVSQSEIVIGNVAANSEFLVSLPINPVHGVSSPSSSYWKFVDGSGQQLTIANSKTGQFWLKISTNRAPEFSQLQLNSVAGKENQQVCLPVLASDPEGDLLSYSVTSGGGSVTNTTGVWQYCNSFPVGVHAVTLKADDGLGSSASTTFQAVITSNGNIKDFYDDVRFADATTQALKDQYQAIQYLTLSGITIGYPADPNDPNNLARIFQPNSFATQAEALAMIMKSATLHGSLSLDAEPRWLPNLLITDVEQGIYKNYTWAAPYVLKAEALGMIPNADTFDPSAEAKREWLATLVTRMLQLNTPVDAIDPSDYLFADSANFSSTEANKEALAAAYFGYMLGEWGSTVNFNPAASMIRADVAMVASKILRRPSAEAIETTGLIPDALDSVPSTPHGQTFNVTGMTNLTGYQIVMDSNGYVSEGIIPASNYTTAKIIRSGSGVVGTKLVYSLATSPVVVPTATPDISFSEKRSLIALLESNDWDGRNPVRNTVRFDYRVLFPDADGDGVRDSVDLWPNHSLYSTDANGNDIPDNADALWKLSSRSGVDYVSINGAWMSLIDAVLSNSLANDLTPPTTTASVPTGEYHTPQQISLTANETAVIRYTLDGSLPNANSTLYSAPLTVSSGVVTINFYAEDLVGNIEPTQSITITVIQEQLTVNRVGAGTITPVFGTINWIGNTGTAFYDTGYFDILMATADPGHTFTGWSGACTGTGNCFVTMNAAKSVTATFEVSIVVASSSAGKGGTIAPPTVTGSAPLHANFTVTAEPGYVITSVTGCGGTLNGNTYTIGSVTTDCRVSAFFSLPGAEAQLNGEYRFVSQIAGLRAAVGGTVQTTAEGNTGSITFDGTGGCSLSVAHTSFEETTAGIMTSPSSETFACSYVGDGAGSFLLFTATEPIFKGYFGADGNLFTSLDASEDDGPEGEYRIDQLIGVKTGAGMSQATLNGTYSIVAQENRLLGTTPVSKTAYLGDGVLTFNGTGGCTINLSRISFEFSGNNISTYPKTMAETCSYILDATGHLTASVNGEEALSGTVSADGGAILIGGYSQNDDGGSTRHTIEQTIAIKTGSNKSVSSLNGSYGFTMQDFRFSQENEGSVQRGLNGISGIMTFDGAGVCSYGHDDAKITENGSGVSLSRSTGSDPCTYSVTSAGDLSVSFGNGGFGARLAADDGSFIAGHSYADGDYGVIQLMAVKKLVPPISTPINGVCGSSNSQTFSTAPTTGLCSSGSVAVVPAGVGPWNWSCIGSNGGTNILCGANLVASGQLPSGSNVSVATTPAVNLSFAAVTVPGTVQILSTSPTSGNIKVAGGPEYSIINGTSYDITSTASSSGLITVCISYNPANVTVAETGLRLLHHTGTLWEDITTSVNTVGKKVCGQTASLSPFVIGKLNSTKPGDGDGDGSLSIAEVQSSLNMFLGVKTPELWVDQDGIGGVTISEVQKVINGFLGL